MKKNSTLLLLILFLIAAAPFAAEAGYTIELFTGTAYNFNSPLTINQDGEDEINMNAEYTTRSFNESPYYSIRLAAWQGNKGWELELLHHKLYLENMPPEIEKFEISHGYNLVTVNRAWKYKGFIYHLGAGLVMAHPETKINGKSQHWTEGLFSGGNKGFYFCGPALQAAVGKRFPFWKKGLFFQLEGKITAGYGWVPVEDGIADVPNLALHGLIGIGYDF